MPRINTVEAYTHDVPANYSVPRSYVRCHRPPDEELDAAIEYVADAEDDSWLQNNTKFGGAVKQEELVSEVADANSNNDNTTANNKKKNPRRRSQITLAMLEQMLDLLEKVTAFDVIVTSTQAEGLILQRIPHLYHLFPVKGRQGVVTVRNVINDVYAYWLQKRSKLKRPLLRRFWPVTSSDDTNPHLVFRPREKEKYKLRKKRQNDMEAYRKMKQLRQDFDNLRMCLELVRRREQLNRSSVQIHIDLFQQRFYDLTDTSGCPRVSSSKYVRKDKLKHLQDLPSFFDVQSGDGKKGRRGRRSYHNQKNASSLSAAAGASSFRGGGITSAGGTSSTDAIKPDNATPTVAGRNHGEPAPNFMHPLHTRERYVTSWDGSVPHIRSYNTGQVFPEPTFRFRRRPRLGRGGRLCIDRLPRVGATNNSGEPDVQLVTTFTAGLDMPRSLKPKERLLELLPRPLNHRAIARKVEEMSVAAIQEDFDLARSAAVASGGGASAIGMDTSRLEENDGEEVVVKLSDWLETDEQLWGEERYAIGPI